MALGEVEFMITTTQCPGVIDRDMTWIRFGGRVRLKEMIVF